MNKRKLGAAVLLLALGLGPVQTSQNYNLKLNNLAYAEDAEVDGMTTEGNLEGADRTQTDNQNQAQSQNEGGDTTGDDKDNLLLGPEVQPGAVRNADPADAGKSDEDTIKEALEAQDKAVRDSGAFKLATKEEITKYEANYSEIEKNILDSLKEGKEVSIEELKGDFLTASMDLGYTVVKNLPKRMELRILKAELEAASKKAGKDYSEDLKNLIKKTDEILASKEHTSEEIEENLKYLTKAVDAYKKENSVEIAPAKLSPEEAKYGYPDDVYSEKEKDLSELRLDARVMLEDYVDDEKAQARKAELDKKVKANTASEAEKAEYADLTSYELIRLALNQKMNDPDIGASDLLAAINAYKEAADKIAVEEKGSDKDSKSDLESKYEKLVKEYEEVKSSDIYKKASDEKKKAYDKALEDFKNKKYTTLEELEAGKTKMEEAKNALSVKVSTEEEKEIEAVLDKHNDFIKSDEYLRATKDLQESYNKAYNDLKADKTKENLDKVKKAKTDISDYYSKFNAEIESLEKYIDQAKSESLTEDSLKKIKKEYKEKLEEIKSDNSKTIDDINGLKEEFDAKLNPKEPEKDSPKAKEDAKKKTTKKVVTSSKKSNGKVRTGVDAILPVVGGVAIVAAIGLIFTRRKNK